MLGTKFDDPVQSSTYLSVLILKNHQTFLSHFICSDLYFTAIFCLSHLAGSAHCFHVHSKAHILSVCHKVSFLSKTSCWKSFIEISNLQLVVEKDGTLAEDPAPRGSYYDRNLGFLPCFLDKHMKAGRRKG